MKVSLMPIQGLQWMQVGALMLFLAVALGAFGAHGLEHQLTLKQLDVWEKGVTYLVIHGLAVLVVSMLFHAVSHRADSWHRVNLVFVLGSLLFSGSLFIWALTSVYWLVFLTPIGGMLFLFGWLMLFWSLRKAAK